MFVYCPLLDLYLRGHWRVIGGDSEGTLESLDATLEGTLEGHWRDTGGMLDGNWKDTEVNAGGVTVRTLEDRMDSGENSGWAL